MMINHWILVSLILTQKHPIFAEHAWNFLQPLDLLSLDTRIAFLPCNFQVRWWIWRPEPCNHCVWRRSWLHSKLSSCAKSAAWTGKKTRKLLKMKMDHQLNMDHCLVSIVFLILFIYVSWFLPLNMDAMITEFECNLFRSVETAKQSIIRRPMVQSKMLRHMLYLVHMNAGFHQPLEKFNWIWPTSTWGGRRKLASKSMLWP